MSSRISFAESISAEFGAVFYLKSDDDDSNIDFGADRIVCSLESLHKMENVRPFDFVFMDESEAVLSIFPGETMHNNQIKTFHLLNKFIRESKKTIFAGAMITNKTIKYALSFDIPVVCIHNTHIPFRKRAVEIDNTIFIQKLATYIMQGGKPYVFTSKKKDFDDIKAQFVGMNNEILNKVMLTWEIYSGNETKKKGDKSLKNIFDVWGKSSIVMTTPTITVGNSFDLRQDTETHKCFTSVWLFCYPSCLACDQIQGITRVRHTTTNTLYFALPNKKALSNCKTGFLHKLELSKALTIQKNAEYNIETINHIIDKLKTEIVLYKYQDTRNKNMEILRQNFNNANSTPRALLDINLAHYHEKMLSETQYVEMILFMFGENNYDIIRLSENEKPTQEDYKMSNDMHNNAVYDMLDYEDIDIITNDEVEKIKNMNYSTYMQKMQVKKYYFDSKIDLNTDISQIRDLFDEYVIESGTSSYFENSREEILNRTEYNIRLSSNRIQNVALEQVSTNLPKLYFINHINNHLGIQNTLQKIRYIDREKIESLCPYLDENHAKIRSAFSLSKKLKKDTLFNYKEAFILLTTIYKGWNRYKFNADKKDRTRKVISICGIPHKSFLDKPCPFIFDNLEDQYERLPPPTELFTDIVRDITVYHESVFSHTDSEGNDKYNIYTSKNR
jgi:hypothetical protein